MSDHQSNTQDVEQVLDGIAKKIWLNSKPKALGISLLRVKY